MNCPRRIEEIDENFRSAELNGAAVVFLDPTKPPFSLHGFAWREEGQRFLRLPARVLADPGVNAGVKTLAWHTAGGRVRFRTNSRIIGVRVVLTGNGAMNHMPRSGSCGFDLFVGVGAGATFRGAAIPALGETEYARLIFRADTAEFRDYALNFPLYNGVKRLDVALEPGAEVEPPSPYAIARPIVFYAGSTTQGACASRPGNAYTHLLSRRLDADFVNLGFSGSAKGEPAIAEAIAELDAAAIVMAYDNNAPDAAYLRQTHEPFFLKIRERRPDVPTLFVSKQNVFSDACRERRDIVRKTYENALARGDRNVYFIDGATLFGDEAPDASTVDGVHPNDLGFWRMAQTIQPVLARALNLEKGTKR